MQKNKEDNNRLTYLDGIRGLLSLIVILNHSFLVIAIPGFANVWGQNYLQFTDLPSKVQQIFMILGNGGTAVSMFFVLAGFVLNFSLSRFSWSIGNYFHFLIKRFLRLYPAFFFTILVISLGRWLGFDYRQFPHASTWYHWWMNFNLDLKEFLLNTVFVNINLGGVTWTLRVIVIFSFFAPTLYYLAQKLNAWQNFLFAILLSFLSFNLLNFDGFRDFRYFYMFYLGLIIPQFADFFRQVPRWLIYTGLPFALYTMFTIRYQTNEYRGGVWESYLSWLILGLIIYQSDLKIFKPLGQKWLLFLGKISYSIYLIHFSVLYTLARVMFQYFPEINYSEHYLTTHLVLLLTSSLVTIPISWFVYTYIERLPEKLIYKKS